MTIDYPGTGGGHMEAKTLAEDGATPYATEFTCFDLAALSSRHEARGDAAASAHRRCGRRDCGAEGGVRAGA